MRNEIIAKCFNILIADKLIKAETEGDLIERRNG